MEEYICDMCGKAFQRYPSNVRGDRVFCSRACMAEAYRHERHAENNPCWRGGKTTQTCQSCGRAFRAYSERKYCSSACFYQANTGDSNNAWAGGLSAEKHDHGSSIIQLRNRIKKRDRFRCAFCGKTTGRLHTHHIDYDKYNHDPSNLITLCTSCHSRTNYNREFWQSGLGLIARLRVWSWA